MNITRIFGLGVALVAMLSSTCELQAQIGITFDSTVAVGSAETLTFSASGPDAVSSFDFDLVIEDGGAIAGGTDTDPSIVSFASTGFLSAASPALSTDTPLAINGNITLATGASVAPGAAPNPFALLTLDTSSLSVGDTFTVALAGAGFDTNFLDVDSNVVETNFSPFVVEVVGAESPSIPEPSSIAVLIALGGVSLMRRKRA